MSRTIWIARCAASGVAVPESTIASAVKVISIWQRLQISSYAIAALKDARSPAPAAPEPKLLPMFLIPFKRRRLAVACLGSNEISEKLFRFRAFTSAFRALLETG